MQIQFDSRFVILGAMLVAIIIIVAGDATAAVDGGSIAYVRAGKSRGEEIRRIEADGGNDRHLWSIPGPAFTGITALAWKPDGKELAFASDHDAACSVFESDLYTIQPDGSGLRKLTNPGAGTDGQRLRTGSLTVVVRNQLLDSSLFVVYAAGSRASQQVVVPGGSAKRLTFTDIADFGEFPHPVAAIDGKFRWVAAGVVVHSGRTADAGTLWITHNGIEHFGATSPAWRFDGRQVAFVLGQSSGLFCVPSQPIPGSKIDRSLIGGDQAIPASIYDLGPTRALANEVLYGGGVGDQAIYRTTEGSGKRGTALIECPGEPLICVQWLPDGSGFLFAKTDFTRANLFRFDFASKKTTQVTHFDRLYAGSFSISPDGRAVVFERSDSLGDSPIDLWTMHLDGTGLRLLVKNGKSPAWGR